MNDYSRIGGMPRNQTLVVVEGDLEKYDLLKVLFKCFPEIHIQMENVHIYKSDVYNLYHQIEEEYGKSWYEERLEIDIPYLISSKFGIVPPLEKRNFTNIIMMFDYERHDSAFSEEKVMRLQKHFNSVEDEGLLYINYPMIESFYHYKIFPDKDYIHRSIPVICRPGRLYKERVREESATLEYIGLFKKLVKMLKSKLRLSLSVIEMEAIALLSANSEEQLQEEIASFIMREDISEKKRRNLECSIFKLLSQQQYMKKGISYWEDIRLYFKTILKDNIEKAHFIQEGEMPLTVKEKYLSIVWEKVLEKQNELSKDCEKGVIMVLCTCITFLGEYKFCWAT